MRKPDFEKRNRRQQEIITIAAELFASQNFHQVLMEEVARRANLAKGTIYNYFKNKEALYFAIITDRLNNLLDMLKDRLNTPSDALTNLRRTVIHIYSFFIKYPHFFKIWYQEKSKINHRGSGEICQLHREIRQVLGRVLETAVSEKVLKPHRTEFMVDIILGMIDAAVVRGRTLSRKEQSRERMELFEFILNGLGTPEAITAHKQGNDEPGYSPEEEENARSININLS